MKKYVLAIIILMSFLFAFPAQCSEGAKIGLLLWFNTMIPSVFPFILLTNLLRAFGGIRYFEKLFGRLISVIFRCSKSGAYAIIVGFLCGYPMGAKAVSDSLAAGYIGKTEADYLMTFCNNPSPMYIMNYVLIAALGRPELTAVYFMAIYAGSWLTAMTCYFFKYRRLRFAPKTEPLQSTGSTAAILLDECMLNALVLMQKIGVFMILFAIFCQLILAIPADLGLGKIIISGIFEQTTGIHAAASLPIYTKTVLAAAFASFGGLATAAQTYGVVGNQGLSIFNYLAGKSLHCMYTILILSLLLRFY